jgi:predicted nucleic acid-binding protein
MTTIHHVLDTGALYHLLDKHRPALWQELAELSQTGASNVWIPSLVLTEAGQAKALQRKKLEKIFELADVAPIDEDVADRAAAALRAATRDKCDACSNFLRPSLVDAVVMAFAHKHVSNGDRAVVYTGDMRDMEKLRDALFAGVTLEACS